MGGLALIARQLGYQVSGSDQNVYPPMSTQLEHQGIQLMQGYREQNLDPGPDLVVIGNAMSRGNPEVEAVLNKGLKYISGPQWLAEHVLQGRWVLGVAGTHGKTTTASMLSWILEDNGLKPGFLIGGIPLNFGLSARLGDAPFFVVEADEYDTAFFDKRSKFVHYRPRTAILNNLEFDHADIFPDLDAIKRQFHHLVRTIPSEGLIVTASDEHNISDVLAMGCWTPIEKIAIASEGDWRAELINDDGSRFEVYLQQEQQGIVDWTLTGGHNVANAMAAIAAARHVEVTPGHAIAALGRFKNVKRRMEVIARINNVTVYDDFAHHPTAIKSTLDGLRKQVKQERIIAVVDPRSNTMRMGIHRDTLAQSLAHADRALVYRTDDIDWDLEQMETDVSNIEIIDTIEQLLSELKKEASRGGHFLLMSNGSFGGIYQRLLEQLQ